MTKRFFPQGEQQAGSPYYYTYDHLGSVREMLNNSGTIVARYSYNPYGRQAKVAGSLDSTFQYARIFYHAASSLNLTYYRAYDPSIGRWLSKDPAEEHGGLNLYDYCLSDPVDGNDHLGLYVGPSPQNAMAAYASGKGGHFSMGPDDDWTKQMAGGAEVASKMTEIKQALSEICSGKRLPVGGDANYNLNDLSPAQNAERMTEDGLSYAMDGAIGTSSYAWFGSFRLHWTIGDLDCCLRMAVIYFHASDKIGLHSMTRIPKTSSSVMSDNDTGHGFFPSVFLDWYWHQEVSF